MKNLMIVGAGPLQLPAYEEARRLGLRITALDRNPDAPGMCLADVARVVDTGDADGAIRVAREEGIDGVMTLCTDFPVRTVSAVTHALGLPGLAPEVALQSTHKGLMRRAFERGGGKIPDFRRVFTESEARAAILAIGFPVIFKPTSSSGSRGVFKLTSLAQVPEAFAYAAGIEGGGSEILVEEFVDGPEVSVEVLTWASQHHIITITDKKTTGDPHWVELGHTQPSRLAPEVQQAIRECAVGGLTALGINNSPSHVEIKVGPRGPRLIEIGARLGGDFITTELVPRSTGVNMVMAAIQMALGIRPNMTPTLDQGAAIRYLVPPTGRVVGVRGDKGISTMPGVVSCQMNIAVGDVLRPVHSSLDRPCHVICVGGDADQAEARAVTALTALTIETEGAIG